MTDIDFSVGNWIALSGGPEEIDRWNKMVGQVEALSARIAELKAERDADMRDLIKVEVITRIQQQAREDALREADRVVMDLRLQNQSVVVQYNEAVDAASDAIAALINKETTHDRT